MNTYLFNDDMSPDRFKYLVYVLDCIKPIFDKHKLPIYKQIEDLLQH